MYELRSIHSVIRKINNLFFYLTISSTFIGINAIFLSLFSFLLYDISLNLNLILIAFLVTFSVYNINKLTDVKEDSINLPERADFIGRNRRPITHATMACYLIALLLSFLQNLFAIFIALFPLCCGVIYSIKILDFRLKDITGVKNIIIALSWAGTGAFLPLLVASKAFIVVLLIFYFFFVRIFIGSVTFDIRDIEGDRMSGVRTIPVVFGREKTKNLLLILNSTLIPWLAISYLSGFFHHYLFVLIFIIAHGYGYILHFCKEGLKIGKSLDLIVDGEWIPVVLLCVLMQRLNLNSHYFFSLISLFKLVGLKEGS